MFFNIIGKIVCSIAIFCGLVYGVIATTILAIVPFSYYFLDSDIQRTQTIWEINNHPVFVMFMFALAVVGLFFLLYHVAGIMCGIWQK